MPGILALSELLGVCNVVRKPHFIQRALSECFASSFYLDSVKCLLVC